MALELDCSERDVTAASFAPGPDGDGGVFSCSVATLAEEAAALDRASHEHTPVRLVFKDRSLLLDLVMLERKDPQSIRIVGQLLTPTAQKNR